MKKIILLILSFAVTIPSATHPWIPSHYFIIYTDGGFDGISAVSMLLASREVRVLAITVSYGVLKVSDDADKRPAVEFIYLNRKIRVSLNPEIAGKISSELKEINFIYGVDSNIYRELVRKNSIKYRLELDRHEIFIIEEIKRSGSYSASTVHNLSTL